MPEEPVYWSNQALSLLKLNNLPEARERVEKALKLAPTSVHVLRVAAAVFEAAGEYALAIEHCRTGLAQNPDDNHRAAFAARLERLSKYKEAPRDADLATKHARLASAHHARGQHREAIAEYTKAIAADGGDASLFARRAECHLALSETIDAKADVKKALDLDPANAIALEVRKKIR